MLAGKNTTRDQAIMSTTDTRDARANQPVVDERPACVERLLARRLELEGKFPDLYRDIDDFVQLSAGKHETPRQRIGRMLAKMGIGDLDPSQLFMAWAARVKTGHQPQDSLNLDALNILDGAILVMRAIRDGSVSTSRLVAVDRFHGWTEADYEELAVLYPAFKQSMTEAMAYKGRDWTVQADRGPAPMLSLPRFRRPQGRESRRSAPGRFRGSRRCAASRAGPDDDPGPEPAPHCERCGAELLSPSRLCGFCAAEAGLVTRPRACAADGCPNEVVGRADKIACSPRCKKALQRQNRRDALAREDERDADSRVEELRHPNRRLLAAIEQVEHAIRDGGTWPGTARSISPEILDRLRASLKRGLPANFDLDGWALSKVDPDVWAALYGNGADSGRKERVARWAWRGERRRAALPHAA